MGGMVSHRVSVRLRYVREVLARGILLTWEPVNALLGLTIMLAAAVVWLAVTRLLHIGVAWFLAGLLFALLIIGLEGGYREWPTRSSRARSAGAMPCCLSPSRVSEFLRLRGVRGQSA